ncbi:MAG: glycosyltransferase family 39 protein [bacterium]
MMRFKPLPSLALILLSCLLLRVGYQLAYIHLLRFTAYFSDPFYEPAVDSYDDIAHNLLNGKGYALPFNDRLARRRRIAWPEQPTAARMPVYPLTLYCIYELSGGRRLPALFMQAVFDTVTCLLIYLLAGQLFNNRLISLLSAGMWALCLPEILTTRKLFSEPLFNVLLVGTVLLSVKAFKSENRRYFAAAGAGFGAAALCRPITLFFPPLWSVVYLVQQRSSTALKKICLLWLGFSLTLLPWVIRNYRQFQVFLPGSTHFGYNFYAGNAALEEKDSFKYLSISQINEKVKQGVPDALSDPRKRNEVALNEFLIKKTFKLIRKAPLKYLSTCLNRFSVLWFNQGRGRKIEIKFVLFGFFSLFFMLTAAAGFIKAEAGRETLLLIGALVGFLVLIPTLVLASWRFSLPVFPYMFIFSSAYLVKKYAKTG